MTLLTGCGPDSAGLTLPSTVGTAPSFRISRLLYPALNCAWFSKQSSVKWWEHSTSFGLYCWGIVLDLKMNCNHWLLTSSSFGSPFKGNLVLHRNIQRLLDMFIGVYQALHWYGGWEWQWPWGEIYTASRWQSSANRSSLLSSSFFFFVVCNGDRE